MYTINDFNIQYKLLAKQEQVLLAYANSQDNLLVNATAGSGKSLILSLLAQMQHELNPSKKILTCAFNVSSTKELAEKMPVNSRVDSWTIHKLALAQLKAAYGNNGWNVKSNKTFTIAKAFLTSINWDYDTLTQDANHLANMLTFIRMTMLDIDTMVREYNLYDSDLWDSNVYNSLIMLGRGFALSSDNPLRYVEGGIQYRYASATLNVLQRDKYQNKNFGHNKRWIDFDDMIALPVEMNKAPLQWDVIFVDEAQDNPRCRTKLLEMSLAKGGRFVAVGDRQQSLYFWVGADSRSMEEISVRFNCTELTLDQSFRCPVAVTNETRNRTGYQIYSVNQEYDGHVDTLSMNKALEFLYNYNPDEKYAVISRTNKPLVGITMDLIAHGIPAKMRGRDFATGLQDVIKKVFKRNDFNQFDKYLCEWYEKENTRLNNRKASKSAFALLDDKIGCLQVIHANNDFNTHDEMVDYIGNLFSDENGNSMTLSSIHRIKGATVNHSIVINMEKLPFIRDSMNDAQITQEYNALFVALTRCTDSLIMVKDTGYF